MAATSDSARRRKPSPEERLHIPPRLAFGGDGLADERDVVHDVSARPYPRRFQRCAHVVDRMAPRLGGAAHRRLSESKDDAGFIQYLGEMCVVRPTAIRAKVRREFVEYQFQRLGARDPGSSGLAPAQVPRQLAPQCGANLLIINFAALGAAIAAW